MLVVLGSGSFGSTVGSCSDPLLMAYLYCCTYVAVGLLFLPMPVSTGLLIGQFSTGWFCWCLVCFLSQQLLSFSRTSGAGPFTAVVVGCLHWCLCMLVGTSTYNYSPLVSVVPKGALVSCIG